ncbi:hypothetical protein LVD15_04300 [Fulvivirga maritima]|uniref:hypothetical protein n=1 Tax=Fulvivirga maritima TaxID=2904247 RepID=UPI001F492563|nr:hypothetical protein [Fulvivirga maritima]UII27653.1 hypothetical protein LVD15_04300 [Fulvivirga maritima]
MRKNSMKEIQFKRTGHTLLNNGILGVYTYLQKAKRESRFEFFFGFDLTEHQLEINSENLIELLDELYYWMGVDMYNTYTLKQEEDADKLQDCNIFYSREQDKFIPFPRMNTYGLTHLLTNNAQGVTRNEDGWTNSQKLSKSNLEELEKFDMFFEKSGLKKMSKLYYEPYTKITRLPKLKNVYIETGDKHCYLTGESFKELVDITNISPFFSGLQNFNSHMFAGDKKISWKARYLSMFSPVHAFYHYPNKLRETIYIYLISSDNLTHQYELLSKIDLTKSRLEIKNQEFVSNIKFSDEIVKDTYTEQFEVALSLAYSLYKKVIKKYGNLTEEQVPDDDLFGTIMTKLPPLALETFQANAHGKTMLPTIYENLNRLTPLFKLFYDLEKKGVIFNRLLPSLKIIKPAERNAKNKFRLERIARDYIASEILENKSILSSMEDLLFRCFNYLCSNEHIGYKDYRQLFLFTELYESKINTMDETLQSAAINLGKQIGIKMRHQDASQSEAANAKKGRGDLISLRKARTHKQFLDELIRVDFKYGLSINEELANKINDQNYYTIKQFLIIGALNILNPAIHPFKQTEKTV